MSKFDYDKIKDMEYDTNRECYVGKDGAEFKVTPLILMVENINMITMIKVHMVTLHIIQHM